MQMQQILDTIRESGLIGMSIAGVCVLLLGACLGVLVAARRSVGGSAEPGGIIDDALAASGAATVLIGFRGNRVSFEQISPSVESLTGYDSGVLCEHDGFLRMLDEHDAQTLERKIASAVQDERATVTDFPYTDADGRTRWMQLRGEPARDGRGRYTKLRGIIREITESKMLSADLSATWSRFHALADATPAMLWVMDADGLVTAVNRSTERFCGVSEAALLGEGWLLAVDEQHHDGLRQFLARVIEEGTSLQRDVAMIDPDNRERLIAMTANVAKDSTGSVASVVLTGRDITDRSEKDRQRERLTRLIESSESPAMIIAPDMRVAMLNPSARTRAGLGDGEAADSIALWHVVTQDAVDQIRGEAIRYCADGGVYRMRGRVRDGQDASLAAEFAVVGLGDGWLGLTARIIEHELAKEAEAQLDRRRLDVMLGALDRLAGGGWAPGRAAERMCEAIANAYPDLRAAFGTADGKGSIVFEASDEPAWMGSAEGRVLRFENEGSILASLEAGEAVTIGDVWAESQMAESVLACEEYATRRLAMLRVATGARAMSVMTLERAEPGRWSKDEMQALELASRMLGLAMRAEHDRKGRNAAEDAAAEQTQRWREERERAEQLARLAADRVTETERLLHRLQKSDATWASALVQLGGKASAAGHLADEAREAGLTSMADQLGRLVHDADRAEIAGRIVSGTLSADPRPVSPREILRGVGKRLLSEAKSRGVVLRISQDGTLPEQIEADERLLRLACAELLSIAVERCASREIRAVAAIEEGDSPRLVLRVTGGGVASPSEDLRGAPGGLALLREIARVLGGTFEVETGLDGTTLTLKTPTEATEQPMFGFDRPLEGDALLGDEGPDQSDDSDGSLGAAA